MKNGKYNATEVDAAIKRLITQNQFGYGVVCMARNCLPALDLIDSGRWTTKDARKWLNAVISKDSCDAQDYAREVAEAMKTKPT
jgi:hypothetical protein